jgi:signal transduction histidine kinase
MIGVLCLGKKKSDEEFAKDDLDILQPLARSLAIAVSNAQLFEELAKTQAEAAQKEKLAVIGTLSAGINHEICNPLGIVKAQCEAFLLDVEDGILVGRSTPELLDRTSNIMRTALKQIDRATAITQKLSNFAKPIKEPTAQPVSVAAEIDEVLLLVGHDLKLEKIEVIKEVQPDLAPILVDRRQLQEVLFNLVRNAGQAITPPGKITIRASERDAQVRIEIEDTGSGIPADKLQKIYDPFFTTKEPGKGTGLGLFIVRQIVERNKGRIAVESAVGKGTTFSLDFQAARTAAAAAR